MDPFALMYLSLKTRLFLKNHWKKLVVAAAVVVAFTAGRYTAADPTERVEWRERVVEKLVVDERRVEEEVSKRVKDIESSMAKRVTKVVVVRPDGSSVTKETTDVRTDRREKVVEVQYVDRMVEKKVYVDRTVEKKVDVEVARAWRAGALMGVQPRLLPTPELGPVLFGAEVERRVIGRMWAGAWGLSSGAVGISVKVEF